MYAHLLSISLAFATLNVGQAATVLTASPFRSTEFPGGPPRAQVCGKLTGDVTSAEWKAASEVKLIGCVASARITSLSVCIKNCEGKQEALTATDGTFTPAMKKMIANLPAGTAFTVRVAVVDATGKKWEVPDAAFVWKG
jgi:hypothetical protein